MPSRMQKQKEGILLSSYRIFETDEFLKKLRKLITRDEAFIQNKLNEYVYPQIRHEPFFGKNIKKLKGYSPNTWRYRIAEFRLFYTLDQKGRIIYMLTLDCRKDAYR